jgi:hypothetical protein
MEATRPGGKQNGMIVLRFPYQLRRVNISKKAQKGQEPATGRKRQCGLDILDVQPSIA